MPRRQRVPYEELSKGASIYAPGYGLPARWQERVGCPVCGPRSRSPRPITSRTTARSRRGRTRATPEVLDLRVAPRVLAPPRRRAPVSLRGRLVPWCDPGASRCEGVEGRRCCYARGRPWQVDVGCSTSRMLAMADLRDGERVHCATRGHRVGHTRIRRLAKCRSGCRARRRGAWLPDDVAGAHAASGGGGQWPEGGAGVLIEATKGARDARDTG